MNIPAWTDYEENTQDIFEEVDELLRDGVEINIDEYVSKVEDPENRFRERFRRELEEIIRHYFDPKIDTLRKVGKYQIRSLIGSGGHADVYRAFDLDMKREVALKVPRENPFYSNDYLKAFRQEIAVMASVEHANIVTVHDTELNIDDDCYIAMEFIQGPSILDIDADDRQVVDIIIQVAKGLQAMHERGFIHRDIKPSNILLDIDGTAKITDFGFAKHVQNSNDKSEMNFVRGTPNYMSPEQAAGKIALDQRTDIFNIGLIFFEMLTGHKPYGDKLTPMESQTAIAKGAKG